METGPGGGGLDPSNNFSSEAAANQNLSIIGTAPHGTVSTSTQSPTGSVSGGGSLATSPSATSPTATATAAVQTSTFRIVTYAGTHIYCSAPTPADRDMWLASLHAGVESSMISVSEVLTEVRASSGGGLIASTEAPPPILEPALAIRDAGAILSPPVPQKRGLGTAFRRRLEQAAAAASSSSPSSAESPVSSFGFTAPYDSRSPPAHKPCISCGRYAPQTAYRPQSCPLAQYGMETRVDTCTECLISQGMLCHVKHMVGMYSTDALERSALVRGREMVRECVEETAKAEAAEVARRQGEINARQKALEKAMRLQSERELMEAAREAGAREVGTIASEENTLGRLSKDAKADLSIGAGALDSSIDEDDDITAVCKAVAETELELGTANLGDAEGEDDGDSSGEGTGGSSWTAVNSNTTGDESDLIVEGTDHDNSIKSKASFGVLPVGSPLSGSWADVKSAPHQSSQNAWVDLPPLPATATALMELIVTPTFQTLRRRSRVLDQNCKQLERGVYGGNAAASEFLEILEERAQEAAVHGIGYVGEVNASAIEMRKQALALSADPGSAIRLLKESALGQKGPTSTETLASVLEYFLDDLEDEGLANVGFFWPQIRQIHLIMLPAVDVVSLVRVELFEDFLLTVCTKHSIHLALELVWGLMADLEESLGTPNEASGSCRRRRFAVMRFICELESLLFDFEGGWGGGGVSLKAMYSPSQHQAVIIKDEFCILQLHRMYGSHYLSRSARLDKLKREADKESKRVDEEEEPVERKEDKNQSVAADSAQILDLEYAAAGDISNVVNLRNRSRAETSDSSVAFAAAERIRTVQNADYYSYQLSFSRRLGDIAERLRFMDVETRSRALEGELDVLNASGKMGGDPLNRIVDSEGNAGSLAHVVHLPRSEGHVFNSKERTPVLLLMELVREVSDEAFLSERRRRAAKAAGRLEEISVEEAATKEQDVVDISIDEIGPGLDAGADVPPSPMTSSRVMVLSKAMESPNRKSSIDLSPSPAEKEEVETLVASMLESQLVLPTLTEDDLAAFSEGGSTNDLVGGQSILSSNQLSPSSLREKPGEVRPSTSRLGGLMADTSDEIPNLSADGDGRREVLTTIFIKGMRSSNTIARDAAPAAQRAVQAMDRQRAVKLMNTDSSTSSNAVDGADWKSSADLMADEESRHSTGHANEDDEVGKNLDDDDLMESLRLLIVQHRVAQGIISAEKAASVLASDEGTNISDMDVAEEEGCEAIDAGDVDPRLAGCGNLPKNIFKALKLWNGGAVSSAELLELVRNDLQYVELSANESKLMDDSNFWGRFAFGERWAEKRARIQTSSVNGSNPGWDLAGVIVKSNDDLRQESFIMQLIVLCQEAFDVAGLELWVHPYRILATGRTTGIIEMVRNAMSFDSLKKRPGYGTDGLRGHLQRMTEFTADPAEAFEKARKNFVRSLASYSLMSYLFLFKDRHNGNLLLDTAGHVIHIDFGFVFGDAPGGNFSLEQAPFKLTEEMLEVMGGPRSALFSEFVALFCCGFLALKVHAETFITLVEITCEGSSYSCFEGKDLSKVVGDLRDRFCLDLDREATILRALDLIKAATDSYGTKQYDYFQYLSQGIAS